MAAYIHHWICPECNQEINVRIPVAGGMGSIWECPNGCYRIDGSSLNKYKVGQKENKQVQINIRPKKIKNREPGEEIGDRMITVTEFGEKIEVLEKSENFTDDGHWTWCGRHLKCDRLVHCKIISDTHRVLACMHGGGCNLRVPFPRTVTNLQELIEYFTANPGGEEGER